MRRYTISVSLLLLVLLLLPALPSTARTLDTPLPAARGSLVGNNAAAVRAESAPGGRDAAPAAASLAVDLRDDEWAGRPPLCPGYTVHFDVIVTNTGDVALDDVLVTVKLSPYIQPLLDSPRTTPGATYDAGAHAVQWTIALLNPGETATFELLTRTLTSVPGGTVLTTQAIVTDDVAGTATDSETTTIAVCPTPSATPTNTPTPTPTDTPTPTPTDTPTGTLTAT
ncbi:MAG TPA: hypothetical protein DEP84_06930, partial [Chloroflexi bacterium]|nr:hypothetical protein [Chloroflexota bacterium]